MIRVFILMPKMVSVDLFLKLYLISVGVLASKPAVCPDGWLQFAGSCYLFGHDAVHFTEAEAYCRQHHNSHLIHLDNSVENLFIKDRLRELKTKSWWMGLTDEMTEGVWKWFDSDETANFTDWYSTEPNDHGPGEDCATFWELFDFKWADLPCTSAYTPICKMKGTSCVNEEIIG